MLIEDYLKSGLKMAKSDYNILLTHSPMLLKEQQVFNSIPDFKQLTDLVISGHFYDGYLSKKLDKYFKYGLLLETAYHDNLSDCKWMSDNINEIAKNITDSLVNYFQL